MDMLVGSTESDVVAKEGAEAPERDLRDELRDTIAILKAHGFESGQNSSQEVLMNTGIGIVSGIIARIKEDFSTEKCHLTIIVKDRPAFCDIIELGEVRKRVISDLGLSENDESEPTSDDDDSAFQEAETVNAILKLFNNR